MKIKLDNAWLHERGLGALSVEAKNALLQHSYDTLELRVGRQLAERMSDAQLDEFEALIDAENEVGALAWLEFNFPNYQQVVADVLAALEEEIRAVAPQILAAEGVNDAAPSARN